MDLCPLSIPQAAFLALAILTAYKLIIYPVWLSPLSKIPNAHWSSPISSLWILWIRYTSYENRTVHAAHLKKGPIVRLGPNEISVNAVEGGIRTIYGGGFEKGEWYDVFANYGIPTMFSTLDSRSHSARKRMISNIYSKSSLQTSPDLHAHAQVILYDRLLPLLQASAQSPSDQGIEFLQIMFSTTMDFITAYMFGLPSSSNFLQNAPYRQHWLSLYHSRHAYTFFTQELVRVTSFLSSYLKFRLIPTWVDDANAEIEAWTLGMTRSALSRVEKAEEFKPGDSPIVVKALVAGFEKEERGKGEESPIAASLKENRELAIASELLDQLAAGQETSGITLTYIAWHLSQDLSLQRALREELLGLDTPIKFPFQEGDKEQLPDSKQLDALPLLHAVIMETLRLNAAIPGGQPRMTPYPSCTLAGHEVPGGVRVNSYAYALHRNEEVFPEAEKWMPERWMGKGEAESKERDRWFWAFSSGGRMCVGSNFAMHEMKLIVAAIYTNFTTHIVDDEGIEQKDGYTVGPKGHKLMLRLESIER